MPPAAPTKSGVDPLPLPSGPSSTAEPKPSWEHPKVTAGLAPLAEAKKNGNDVIRATSDGASLVPASNGGGGPAVRAGSNLASAAPSQKSDDALRLAITLAIDAKEYQRAAELLAVRGFEVLDEAADGEQALAAVAGRCPDGVLLDVNLPGQDGFAVAASLAVACAGIRIVLTSADIGHVPAACSAKEFP